ncbi:MAG TPA: hypothetical protein VFB32_02330 [Rudaea sp.]|nr:hypothetical protein [Rudaea sp.]
MIKQLLAKVGLGSAASSLAPAPFHEPYAEAHLNLLYNLLFCDNLDLLRSDGAAMRERPWSTLLDERPDLGDMQAIADAASSESRVRAFAYARLRACGGAVTPKILLGVVVEVPLDRGLDTLAAYGDGRVRYLNPSGKAALFESGPPRVETLGRETVLAALPLVQRIGPWTGSRLPPPRRGDVRVSFLVSDGLYFGEGRFDMLCRDALAGPVLARATELLGAVVEPRDGRAD